MEARVEIVYKPQKLKVTCPCEKYQQVSLECNLVTHVSKKYS